MNDRRMSDHVPSDAGPNAATESRTTMIARLGLIFGGGLGLAVTPAFALAYLPAYGSQNGESLPPWLDALGGPLRSIGLLGGDAVATYTRYGKLYGAALLIVTVSLALFSPAKHYAGRRESRAWGGVLVGMGLLTLGTFGDYALEQGSTWANNGFGLELLGLLVLGVATPYLGWAMRKERRLSPWACLGVAAVGPASLVLGSALTAHIPSGPASLFLAAAIAIGITGWPRCVAEGRPDHSAAVPSTG